MVGIIMHALLLALGLILPLGVQNIFIFQQGMVQRRFWSALPAVITAGICDTLLISLAVGGVSLLVLGLPWIKHVLMIGGIVFLLYMGYITWRSSIQAEQGNRNALSIRKQIVFALSVSLLNPHALLDTIGVIGISSLPYEGSDKFIFTITCIIVSWVWFVGLAVSGHWVGRLDQSGKWLPLLNKCSALMIWGIALFLLYRYVFGAF
ncbi:lysine transporter LysE [Paenibacillus sp. CFBP13512]|uniref:LysE/ArgO family amino acid transporter n=1 Tax=Paenibacillus sp. CFBP13512 TaxID=2184007 RepID=UPI0010C01C81|nr:LysE family transporter [Paenibacillus sp. CFBP13512]TKJ93497.1 lysine transporter LysE [Paenibacillus sp. CFBP13512]